MKQTIRLRVWLWCACCLLPAGMKCFYLEILVRAWGQEQEVALEPRTETQSLHGPLNQLQLELSSTRRFKLQSAMKGAFWAITLDALAAE